jgi:outer membrane protein assembly factor BamB
MVDLKSGEVLFRHEFTKYNDESTSQSVPLIVEEQTGRVALSKDGQVKIFDPSTRRFVLEEQTAKVPGATTFVMASMHDGKVLFGAGRELIEMDMKTGDYRVVASFSEGEPFAITADRDGTVYVSVSVDVYAVDLAPTER